MFLSTEGILIRKVKLSNGGYILKIFTEKEGINSFFIRDSKKNKAILQPLTILSLVSYFKENKEVHNIKEVSIQYPYLNIYQDVYKSNILLFVNEMLDKTLTNEESNIPLYTFLKSQLILFDQNRLDINFHLKLLAQLPSYLGIEIILQNKEGFFDIENGDISIIKPRHTHFYDKEHTAILVSLFSSIQHNTPLTVKNEERKKLIEMLLEYYRYHLGIPALKSLPVLESIF